MTIDKKDSLKKINNLNPVSFKFHNERGMIGFIGQEIKEVIPETISYNEQYVNTINRFAIFEVMDNQTMLRFTENHKLNSNEMQDSLVQPISLLLIDDNNYEHRIIIREIVSDTEVLLDTNIETSGNYNSNKVMVIGPKVKDFHVVNQQPIISMCVSAIQELTEQFKQLQLNNIKLLEEMNKLRS